MSENMPLVGLVTCVKVFRIETIKPSPPIAARSRSPCGLWCFRKRTPEITMESISRLVVSKITAIPLAKNVKGFDWIEGIQRLTEVSIELKLGLKTVTKRKPKKNTKQMRNNPRSLRGNFRILLITFQVLY
jgi:hypothetical protein